MAFLRHPQSQREVGDDGSYEQGSHEPARQRPPPWPSSHLSERPHASGDHMVFT